MTTHRSRFERLGELGRGGSGKVVQYLDTETGEHFAAKTVVGTEDEGFVDGDATRSPGAEVDTAGVPSMSRREKERVASPNTEELLREYKTFAEVTDHPNVVKHLGLRRINNATYLCSEYIPGGNLLQRMENKQRRKGEGAGTSDDEGILASIARQLVAGVKHLHDHNVVHGDLKPSNVLIVVPSDGPEEIPVDDGGGLRVTTSSGSCVTGTTSAEPLHVKITDFGVSKHFIRTPVGEIGETATASTPTTLTASAVGTVAYAAPELLLEEDHESLSVLSTAAASGEAGSVDDDLSPSNSGSSCTSPVRGEEERRQYRYRWDPQRVSCTTPESDVWALGITLAEVALGRLPWRASRSRFALAAEIKEKEPVFLSLPHPLASVGLSPVAEDFVRRCLQRDPARRLSCDQLLHHPFVSVEHWKQGPTPTSAAVLESIVVQLELENEDEVKEEEQGRPLAPAIAGKGGGGEGDSVMMSCCRCYESVAHLPLGPPTTTAERQVRKAKILYAPMSVSELPADWLRDGKMLHSVDVSCCVGLQTAPVLKNCINVQEVILPRALAVALFVFRLLTKDGESRIELCDLSDLCWSGSSSDSGWEEIDEGQQARSMAASLVNLRHLRFFETKELHLLPAPSSLHRIGDYFMQDASSLTELDLTAWKHLRSIGRCFLKGCVALRSLRLPTKGKASEKKPRKERKIEESSAAVMLASPQQEELKEKQLKSSCGGILAVGDRFLDGCTSIEELPSVGHALCHLTRIEGWFLNGCSRLSVLDLRELCLVTEASVHLLEGCEKLMCGEEGAVQFPDTLWGARCSSWRRKQSQGAAP